MSTSCDSDTELAVCAISSVIIGVTLLRRKKKPKVHHVNPYLQGRKEKGRFNKDLPDMLITPRIFQENFHMPASKLEELLNIVGRRLLPKADTRPNDAISPKEKLCVTLEFLASGSLQRHIASTYRISKQRIGVIIEETCKAIYAELRNSYMKTLSKADWVKVANQFNLLWNFPNTLGALDGKHVAIKCPLNAGSTFYNYKGYHSVILMALAAADYRFLFIDVGAYGSESDSQVFQKCTLGQSLQREALDFPEDAMVYGRNVPHFFVADDAFPLLSRMMKPFAAPRRGGRLTDQQRIFNYRLSRARRCVENAFGILCARWICLARTLFMKPDRSQYVIAASCVLHNYLLHECQEVYSPPGFADSVDAHGNVTEGRWRRMISENSMFNNTIADQNATRARTSGSDIREHICSFVNSEEGALEWQRASAFLEP